MKIGEISKFSGISRDTIRYYEKLELLTVESRHLESNYKRYGSSALGRLAQIQQLKAIGFTLGEIRQLLCDKDAHNPCEDLPSKLKRKIDRIDEQVATLHRFKTSLLKMYRACDGNCETLSGMPTCIPPVADVNCGSKCC